MEKRFENNNFETEKDRMLQESIKRINEELASETDESKKEELQKALKELENKKTSIIDSYNKTPEVGPFAEKFINEGKEISDTATKLASVRLLNEQIDAHKDAINSRDVSEASDLKNETDKAIIEDLEKKISNLQTGKEEPIEVTSDVEEPYLKA